MVQILNAISVDVVLAVVILITLLVWLMQELPGRWYRVMQLKNRSIEVLPMGLDAGFPVWLRMFAGILAASWLVLAVTIYVKRDGDFALILVALVLLSGLVSLVDKLVFRQRRVRMLGAAPVQQVLSGIKSDDRRQALVDWAESDFTVAEYAKSFFPVLLVVLLLRSFLIEPFKIPSASMVPTLQIHDFILVNKFAYGLRLPVVGTKIFPVGSPARGDVMVFYPPNDKRYFIKRVIGLPGDQIQLRDNVLYINGVKMEQHFQYVDNQSGYSQIVSTEDLQPREHLIQYFTVLSPQSNYSTVVPEGAYFVMGDNRDNSSDSRFWGMVPESNVVGKAVYIWMHWGDLLTVPTFSRNAAIQ